jgi:uncharacterized protein with HEPN domain
MPRDSKVYLEDILEAARKIRSYTDGLSYESFRLSPMAVDAVIRNLEVIGEAAKQIPDSIRSQAPEVPWKRIAGLRDILNSRLLRDRFRDHLGCGHGEATWVGGRHLPAPRRVGKPTDLATRPGDGRRLLDEHLATSSAANGSSATTTSAARADHRHLKGTESPYRFVSIDELLADFVAEVKEERRSA